MGIGGRYVIGLCSPPARGGLPEEPGVSLQAHSRQYAYADCFHMQLCTPLLIYRCSFSTVLCRSSSSGTDGLHRLYMPFSVCSTLQHCVVHCTIQNQENVLFPTHGTHTCVYVHTYIHSFIHTDKYDTYTNMRSTESAHLQGVTQTAEPLSSADARGPGFRRRYTDILINHSRPCWYSSGNPQSISMRY